MQSVGTRNGIIGAKRGGNDRRCAYTGHEMSLTATGNMFSFVGGFSPRSPHKDPYDFARKLHMRDGELKGDPEDFEKPRVTASAREPGESMEPLSDMPTDEAMAAVEATATKNFKSGTVSVPGGVPKAKKGR